MSCHTRRELLKLLGAGAVVACVGCGSSGSDLPPGGDVSAGNLSDLAVGQLTALSGAELLVGRDAQGVYAMSAICTHQGCDMTQDGTINAQGVFCTCHGSQFDANGNVVSGPARSALPHFAVSVDSAGAITVHASQQVDASVRTAV